MIDIMQLDTADPIFRIRFDLLPTLPFGSVHNRLAHSELETQLVPVARFGRLELGEDDAEDEILA